MNKNVDQKASHERENDDGRDNARAANTRLAARAAAFYRRMARSSACPIRGPGPCGHGSDVPQHCEFGYRLAEGRQPDQALRVAMAVVAWGGRAPWHSPGPTAAAVAKLLRRLCVAHRSQAEQLLAAKPELGTDPLTRDLAFCDDDGAAEEGD